jgi:hypothetical protein
VAEHDGTFAFADLARGTYALEISGGGAAPRKVRGIRIESKETKELGDIALDAAGRVKGRVLVGAGTSPFGLEILLDDDWERSTNVVSEAGEFALEAVAPGEHALVLQESPPIVMQQISAPVVVVAGQTSEVVIDARGSAPARVRIRVTRHDRPVAGIKVAATQGSGMSFFAAHALGTTDADGVFEGAVAVGKPTRFGALAASGLCLGSSEALSLVAGGLFEAAIAVSSGELVIVFPDSFEMPEHGTFQLQLRESGAALNMTQQVQFATPSVGYPLHQLWRGRRCVVGEIAPGAYTLRLDALKLTRAKTEWDSVRIGSAIEAEVTVREGETTTFDVPR